MGRVDQTSADLQRVSAITPGTRGSPRLSRAYLFVFLAVTLSALYAKPLIGLVQLALSNELYSHIPLIPVVSGYLVWLKRRDLLAAHSAGNLPAASTLLKSAMASPALLATLFGLAGLGSWLLAPPDWRAIEVNSLSVLVLSYVSLLWGVAIAVFGWATIRALLFPVVFLIFTVPFPAVVTEQIEVFFQYASAEAAAPMLALSNTPVFREGLFFKLPGVVIEVAQECSGIRSTLVLCITSLVAGYMFFEFPRYRAILTLAVIPIAIIRNGLRIFTIAMLCVYVGPHMIDSIIHRRGGPLFFGLSLIPLFALLFYLYRRERKLIRRAGDTSPRVRTSNS